MSTLSVDRDQIAQYANCIFKHASDGQTVAIRSFYEGTSKVFKNPFVRINGRGLNEVVGVAANIAQQAADSPEPVVFSPIPAGFKDSTNAEEGNLSAGLVLCVECDAKPVQARGKLETVLGRPTLAVESGGFWIDE